MPIPRGTARPKEDDPAEERPTWKLFESSDSDTETNDNSGDDDSEKLWSDPWSDGWEGQLEDEVCFFDGISAVKEAPDAEHFVSDHALAEFYVATQKNG